MLSVAIAIVCKTPMQGLSKTRLSPPLNPEECAGISACFIRDLASTIEMLTRDGDVAGYALYTPVGTEAELRKLLPRDFRLVPQGEGDLGARLLRGTADILKSGCGGVILVNSDSPTLPRRILRDAADAVRRGDHIVLSPAHDGGYTLIGLSLAHEELFSDMPWSTSDVFRLTIERARRIGVPVATVDGWYDVDDAASFAMLQDELSGKPPAFAAAGLTGAEAPATRRFLRERQPALTVRA